MDATKPALAPPPKPIDEDSTYFIVCDVFFAVLAALVGTLCVLAGGWMQRLLGSSLLLTAVLSGVVARRLQHRARGSWAGSWLVTFLAIVYAGLLIWYTAVTTFSGDGAEVGLVGYIMLGFAGRAIFLLMSRPEILRED